MPPSNHVSIRASQPTTCHPHVDGFAEKSLRNGLHVNIMLYYIKLHMQINVVITTVHIKN
jgi:hypothetical protein